MLRNNNIDSQERSFKRAIKLSPNNFAANMPKNIHIHYTQSHVRILNIKQVNRESYPKSFVPKISGTLEHTELLSHIIRDAKRKQRSLVITLLDLQNAFGEVQYGLIDTMLKYHHIPDHVLQIMEPVSRSQQLIRPVA